MNQPWQQRSALATAGWTEPQIDSARRRGRLLAVTRGVLLPAARAGDIKSRCGAALASQRADAAISHRTAAVVHDWPWAPAAWRLDDNAIDVTAARDDVSRSRREGLNRRIAALPPDDVVCVEGIRVTSMPRTLVDLARTESQVLAVQLMDWALTSGGWTADDLYAVTSRMVRVPNVTRARAAIALSRPGVDSPAETTARLQVVHAGLAHPDTCLRIEDDDGVLLARGDLGYWRWLIWIEYDGWETHRERGVFASDRARDRWLARRGWEGMRLTARDLAQPRNWLRQLDAAIRDAPARIAAMAPTRSPEVAAAQRLLARRS